MAGLNEKSLRCFAHQRPQALLIYEVHRLRKRRSVFVTAKGKRNYFCVGQGKDRNVCLTSFPKLY